MDETVLKKIEQKIRDSSSDIDRIKRLAESTLGAGGSDSFALGIIVGRLYNSFCYQYKRVLDRKPTDAEFDEFLNLVESKKSDLEDLW